MKIKAKSMLVFILSVLAFNITFSQNQSQTPKQPLPLVNYNANVEAPLNAKELAQIKEVYGNQAESQILNRPQRLKDVKNILRNRIVFKKVKSGSGVKSYPLLSTVPLFDTFVDNLKRDRMFNQDNFNPLKYEFNFHSRNSYIFKIDNADYYVIIKSQHQ